MIDWLGIALALIVFFFAVFLGLKRVIPRLGCALCAAVSATWLIFLLGAIAWGVPVRSIVAIMVGQSAVGLMYMAAKKIPEDFLVFRLAYICLALVLSALIGGIPAGRLTLSIITGLWIISIILYLYRKNPLVRALFEKIISCCKNW